MTLQTDKNHWSEYWRNGRLTPFDHLPNYQGATATFWEQQFKRLTRNARVLDVCSGNGAIALLAQQYSERINGAFDISAVDAADIDPTLITSNSPEFQPFIRAINYIKNTRLEELDTGGEPYDLVTSQYGVEYTNLDESAKRMRTLLKTGGHFAVVTHTPESIVVKAAKHHVEDFALLSKAGLFTFEDKLRKRDYLRRRFIRELDTILSVVYEGFESRRSPLLGQIGEALEPFCKLDTERYFESVKMFIGMCESLRHHRSRQQDLVRAAEALKGQQVWYTPFVGQGFELMDSGEIVEEKEQVLVGRHYCFKVR